MNPTSPPRKRPAGQVTGWRPNVAVGAALLVIGILTGLRVTAAGAAETGELGLDVTISQQRTPTLTWLAQAIDVLAGTTVAPLLLLLAGGLLWRRHRAASVTVAGLTAVGWLSVQVGKVLVHRPRPPH